MFTSRAEYRLSLREDTADLRLTEIGRDLKLVDDYRWQVFNEKCEAVALGMQHLRSTWIGPQSAKAEAINQILEKPISKEVRLFDILARSEVTIEKLIDACELNTIMLDEKVAEQCEIQTKYAGYIDLQQEEIAKQMRYETTALPENFDYTQVSGLSNEVRQKLNLAQPATIGIAARISGVTPAAISLLLVYLKKQNLLRARTKAYG
jgi:tRNA uridine 5-carboxymethylaminomethyl modification enzyme